MLRSIYQNFMGCTQHCQTVGSPMKDLPVEVKDIKRCNNKIINVKL